MLPPEIQESIYKLFITMWATRLTLMPWKTSETILIDKNKEEETEIATYRPIGLSNTLNKLWTRMVTNTLSDCINTRRSTLPPELHTSRIPDIKRYHPPTPKCHHGTSRCQSLREGYLCPHCRFHLSLQRKEKGKPTQARSSCVH